MNFKQIRKKSGLSKQALAVKFEVTVRTITNWENGFIKPKKYVIEYLRNISDQVCLAKAVEKGEFK